jgi:hypothetical protein
VDVTLGLVQPKSSVQTKAPQSIAYGDMRSRLISAIVLVFAYILSFRRCLYRLRFYVCDVLISSECRIERCACSALLGSCFDNLFVVMICMLNAFCFCSTKLEVFKLVKFKRSMRQTNVFVLVLV